MPVKIIFLGTSAARPTTRRGLSCTCLVRDGEIFMFDAGEGVQISYMRAGLGWNKKMRILVTHMHGDHCIGVLGMLQTMSMQGRTEMLEIFGPAGMKEFIDCNIRSLNFNIGFPIIIHPVDEGTVVDCAEYSIHACRAEHTVEAYSYVFAEKPRPGRFLEDNALALGIPRGRLWGVLQRGGSIEVDGRTVHPSEVMGRPRPGKRIGISGDTRAGARLGEFFAGCDHLVFDATFSEQHRERAEATMHSTAADAARLAHDAGVGHLVLTHFSARYPDVSVLVREAEGFHGNVTAARDLEELEIR